MKMTMSEFIKSLVAEEKAEKKAEKKAAKEAKKLAAYNDKITRAMAERILIERAFYREVAKTEVKDLDMKRLEAMAAALNACVGINLINCETAEAVWMASVGEILSAVKAVGAGTPSYEGFAVLDKTKRALFQSKKGCELIYSQWAQRAEGDWEIEWWDEDAEKKVKPLQNAIDDLIGTIDGILAKWKPGFLKETGKRRKKELKKEGKKNEDPRNQLQRCA